MIVATSVLIAIGDSEGSDYRVVAIIDKGSTSILAVSYGTTPLAPKKGRSF